MRIGSSGLAILIGDLFVNPIGTMMVMIVTTRRFTDLILPFTRCLTGRLLVTFVILIVFIVGTCVFIRVMVRICPLRRLRSLRVPLTLKNSDAVITYILSTMFLIRPASLVIFLGGTGVLMRLMLELGA